MDNVVVYSGLDIEEGPWDDLYYLSCTRISEDSR
jgi:hypothetical protein